MGEKMPMPKNQNLVVTRYEYRIIYSKQGRARYISHLDLLRAMQRAFKRAGVPLWYTQGFNPHSYLMFPLALPLGTDSRVEILDVALTEELSFEEIKNRLNEKMPEGLAVERVCKPVLKHTEISAAEYEIRAKFNESPDCVLDKLRHFLERETIEIEKRSKKKGVLLVDIKPYITLLSAEEENDCVLLRLRLPAGNEFNLNTSVVMDTLCRTESLEITTVYAERTKILAKSGEIFT